LSKVRRGCVSRCEAAARGSTCQNSAPCEIA
jgi:hypothetical protein